LGGRVETPGGSVTCSSIEFFEGKEISMPVGKLDTYAVDEQHL
jgi:hypothetical protein